MLPKTTKTLKEEVLPRIASFFPTFKRKDKEPSAEVTARIMDIEAIQKQILEKLEEEKQLSGAFDMYHQTSPTSITPNVMQQLYGRDLHFLRQYYQTCSPIDQLIFGKRFEQFRAVSDCVGDNPKKVGWRVVHKQQDSPNFRVTKDIAQKCRWFELLIQSPNKMRHPGGFPDVGVAMLESKMLFDRIPIEKCEHKNWRGSGLPASYLIPDAATIKPTTWVLHAMAGSSGYNGKGQVEQARSVANDSREIAGRLLSYDSPGMRLSVRNMAKQLTKKNGGIGEEYEFNRLMSGIVLWVQQMPDKMISAGYTKNNINVFIGNPSTQVNSWGWSSGSAFDRSFAFGEVIFKMTGLNQEIFDSRMPDGVLAITNAGVDKKTKQQFNERMHDEGSDRFSNLIVQYVGDPDKDVKYTKLKDKPHEMQFREMFLLYIKLKCSAYGFDYTELNIEDGRSGGQGGSGSHEKRMDNAAATGIQSDTRYIAHCLTESLIAPWSPDYKMEFVHDVSESTEHVELNTKKLSYTSIAETRLAENLPLEWWQDLPKDLQEQAKNYALFFHMPGLAGTQIVQLINKKLDQDMQEKMQAQSEQAEGAPGDEGGQEVEEPEENPEITKLRAAIGQEESENQDLEQQLEKSFAVRHYYV